jgi:hypothetical protein
MAFAAEHDAATVGGHDPAYQRIKGVADRLFARQNPGAMSLSRPTRARAISGPFSVTLSPITAIACSSPEPRTSSKNCSPPPRS